MLEKINQEEFTSESDISISNDSEYSDLFTF